MVWVSEVMLQQTRMEVVLRYYAPFIGRFPSIAALADASEEAVLASWSGLGYYRRARMLRAGAADVTERFGGQVPADVESLMTIPGVGRYTAGAIASIAHGRQAPIVDGNVARILFRLFGIETPAGWWRQAGELVAACRKPREFNQGLMEIGALICKPQNPECPRCPVKRFCTAFAAGRADQLPPKRKAGPPRAMTIPLYIISDGAGRVLMRRESGKLMTGMFHLPHGDTSLLTGEALRVTSTQLLGSFRHRVTTRKIEFCVYAAALSRRIRDGGGEYAWIDPRELSRVPHASYVRKALAVAGPVFTSS